MFDCIYNNQCSTLKVFVLFLVASMSLIIRVIHPSYYWGQNATCPIPPWVEISLLCEVLYIVLGGNENDAILIRFLCSFP